MSFIPVAGIIIYNHTSEEILLLKRVKYPYETFYAVPGGKCELGETPKVAAIRELEEETGIKSEIMSLDTILNEIYIEEDRVKFQYLIYYYLAVIDEKVETIESNEGKLTWYNINNLPTRIVPSDKKVLERLITLNFEITSIQTINGKLTKTGFGKDYSLDLDYWENS